MNMSLSDFESNSFSEISLKIIANSSWLIIGGEGGGNCWIVQEHDSFFGKNHFSAYRIFRKNLQVANWHSKQVLDQKM